MSALTRRILFLIEQAEQDIRDPRTPKSDYFESSRQE